jgi:hypothetical protein
MERTIAQSDYMLGSWFSLIIVLQGVSFIGLNALDIPKWVFLCLFIVSLLLVFVFSSYFFLNKTSFYDDRIERTYFIKHSSYNKRIIPLTAVKKIVYAYTGGKGSAGNGQLRLSYLENSKVRVSKCSMDNHTAAKVCNVLKDHQIEIVLKPKWVLKEYGYS